MSAAATRSALQRVEQMCARLGPVDEEEGPEREGPFWGVVPASWTVLSMADLGLPPIDEPSSLGIVGIATVREANQTWSPVVLGNQDVWVLPAQASKSAAVEAGAAVVSAMTTAFDRMDEAHPRATTNPSSQMRATAKALALAISRPQRIAQSQDRHPRQLKSTRVRTALLEVKPTTPTEEVFAEIERIAHGFGLAVNEVLDAWLDLHEYDGTTPILAELESGLRVEMTDDANEDIDTLVLQVVGESLASVDYSTMNEFMQVIEAVYRRIPLEVFHITTEGMHEIVARHLLGSILIEKAHDKQLEVLSEIFPHLSFQPEEVAASMRAARTASVVLLGKDTEEGLLRLDRIREGIEAMRDLTCILVREQPEVFAENLSTKVLAYCTLARFIIVENSEPSGHLYEIGLLANTGVVVVVLEERGSRATQMVDGTITNNRRFRRFAYTERTLPNVLATARAWAEKQIGEPDPPWKRDK